MKSLVRQKAYQIGFDLVGFADDFAPRHAAYFNDWFENKKFASMGWLGRNADKRLRPDTILEGTSSVIVVGASYNHETSAGDYEFARYAFGRDYHVWMKDRLEALALFVASICGEPLRWRSFVDTGPVLERDLAAKAGLGWIGKNTCLINRELGSYVFLGVLFCDVHFANDAPTVDACATCRLCIDACPTGALGEYQLDPGLCLAYHNIEHRGERDPAMREKLGAHLLGCDVCQEVCPWNGSAPESRHVDWLATFAAHGLGDLKKILQMSPSEYKLKTRDTAVSRVTYEDFMRNAFLVIANARRSDLRGAVYSWGATYPGIAVAEREYCQNKLSGR